VFVLGAQSVFSVLGFEGGGPLRRAKGSMRRRGRDTTRKKKRRGETRAQALGHAVRGQASARRLAHGDRHRKCLSRERTAWGGLEANSFPSKDLG